VNKQISHRFHMEKFNLKKLSGVKSNFMLRGLRHADHVASSIRKVGTNFADKRRSLGIVRSLTQATELVS
jgi:hypothetical protein